MPPPKALIQMLFRPSRLIVLASLVGLYFTTRVNYLLFHTLAELFSIVVAFSLFMIAWNARRYIRNSYLLFIGIAYLFIGFLDLLHTLSYKGMSIFTDYDFYANQLWIGARYLEAGTLLLAFAFLTRKRKVSAGLVIAGYTVVTALVVASVFVWKIFPICFVEGEGLTPFKRISEYVICGILAVDMGLLWRHRHRFEKHIYRLLLWSMACTVVSELAFTFYISNYGFSNLVGHYFKIFSYFFVYDALIRTGIRSPYELIFRDLDQANRKLQREIAARKRSDAARIELIDNLTHALDEVKTLQGILPICSHCKKIRNEEGAWQQVETYVHAHSDADFSHGICPECAKKHYPELFDEEEQ